MRQNVQILSQRDKGDGIRVLQLSPLPDTLWWTSFRAVVARRLDEVGPSPSAAVETGHGGDEIEISGITAETSLATDQWLSRVVTATNRELHVEP